MVGAGTCCGAHGCQTQECGGGGGRGGGGEEGNEAKIQSVEGLKAKVEAKVKSMLANETQPFTPSLPDASVDANLVSARGGECEDEAVRDAGGVAWDQNARVEMEGGQGAEMEMQEELVAMGFTREQVGRYTQRDTHTDTLLVPMQKTHLSSHIHTHTHTHIHELARAYIHLISPSLVWHNLSLSPPPFGTSRRQQR